MANKGLRFAYDKEGDILDISVGMSGEAISNEIADDFFVRIDPRTNEIVGFSILNFEKTLGRKKTKAISVPVNATFQLIRSSTDHYASYWIKHSVRRSRSCHSSLIL